MLKILNKIAVICMLAVVIHACNASSEKVTDLQLATSAKTSELDLVVVDDLPPPPNTGDGNEVPIAVDDQIEIDVFQVDQLDRKVKVAPDGTVTLPLIGDVTVEGKSANMLEQELEQLYGERYLEAPEITVAITNSAGQRIVMDGEFGRHGFMNIGSGITLMQAIANAGGLSGIGDEGKIWVFREVGGRKLVANYSIYDIRRGQRPDPRLYGGDIVVSFPSDAKVAARNLREALGVARTTASVATFGGL